MTLNAEMKLAMTEAMQGAMKEGEELEGGERQDKAERWWVSQK